MTPKSAPDTTVPPYLITGGTGFVDLAPDFTNRATQAALHGTGITAPEFTTYAPALWNYRAARHRTTDKRSARQAASARRLDDERFDQYVLCDDDRFAPIPKLERHRLRDEIYTVALD